MTLSAEIFGPQQPAWVMHGNKAHQVTIRECYIRAIFDEKGDPTPEVSYTVTLNSPHKHDVDTKVGLYAEEIFPSKEALLASL